MCAEELLRRGSDRLEGELILLFLLVCCSWSGFVLIDEEYSRPCEVCVKAKLTRKPIKRESAAGRAAGRKGEGRRYRGRGRALSSRYSGRTPSSRRMRA